MAELERILIGDAAAAAPAAVVEGLTSEIAHQAIDGVPRTIYQELWHTAFWLEMSIDWIRGIETPFPTHDMEGFPSDAAMRLETWEGLRERFLAGLRVAAMAARDQERLDQPIRCPSRPGHPVRLMTVREQLENMAAHNTYHLGRIVLMRQMLGAWPPVSGGYAW